MTHYENTYCRPEAAKTFNRLGAWDSNPNLMFRNRRNGGTGNDIEIRTDNAWYEGGRPDGFAAVQLVPDLPAFSIAVECKAFAGSLYLGDPNDETATSGWHYRQRVWYEHKAKPVNRLYYIYLWLYPEREPSRIRQDKAYVYLAPAQAWLDYEALLGGRKSIALLPSLEREIAYRDRCVIDVFKAHQLTYVPGHNGEPHHFQIPPEHHLYRCSGRTV